MIDREKIESYREQVTEEMTKINATEDDMELLTYAIILKGIRNNKEPKDLALELLKSKGIE